MYCDYQKFQIDVIKDCIKSFEENEKNMNVDFSDMTCTIMQAKRIIGAAEEIARSCNNKMIVAMLKTNSPFEEG